MSCFKKCETGSGNTGLMDANEPFGILSKVFIMSIRDKNGDLNKIDFAADLDAGILTQAKLDILMNREDTLARLIPVIDLEEIEVVLGDDNFQEFAGGRKVFLSKGIRSFTSTIPERNRRYLGQLEHQACREIGVFLVDECDRILGNSNITAELQPIKLSSNTWRTNLQYATHANSQNIIVTWDFDRDEQDSDHDYIDPSDITADIKNVEGLNDVVLSNPAGTLGATSEISFDGREIYGDAQNKNAIKIFLASDFDVTTDPLEVGAPVANVVVSSSVDATGRYTLIMTTNLVATDLSTVLVNKDGFESNILEWKSV